MGRLRHYIYFAGLFIVKAGAAKKGMYQATKKNAEAGPNHS